MLVRRLKGMDGVVAYMYGVWPSRLGRVESVKEALPETCYHIPEEKHWFVRAGLADRSSSLGGGQDCGCRCSWERMTAGLDGKLRCEV